MRVFHSVVIRENLLLKDLAYGVVFRQSDVHHSEERYLELLDSFNGVTETHWQFHLLLLNRITWRYWTVSPGVTGQFHLALLDRHLTLLDSFTWLTVLLVVTERTGQFHLVLLKPFTWHHRTRAVQCAATNSLICDCFLKWSQSTWQISQWHRKISCSIFSK